MKNKDLIEFAATVGVEGIVWGEAQKVTAFNPPLAEVTYIQDGQAKRARYPDAPEKFEQFARFIEPP